MSNKDNNRVLNRIGAHELTPGEVQKVTGGFIPTLLSVILTGPVGNPDERLDT